MDKKIVITYGTFDLLHKGHIKILKRAKALGDYLIVGVSSDEFNKSKGKVAFDSFERREGNLKQHDFVDQVIKEDHGNQKAKDIKKYGVDTFVMGSDGKGKFDELNELTQVIYFPRTKFISSTKLRAKIEKNNTKK